MKSSPIVLALIAKTSTSSFKNCNETFPSQKDVINSNDRNITVNTPPYQLKHKQLTIYNDKYIRNLLFIASG